MGTFTVDNAIVKYAVIHFIFKYPNIIRASGSVSIIGS